MRSSSHRGFFGLAAGIALLAARPADAFTFNCAGGDVNCLITSIRSPNGFGGANVINLGPGTYHLTSVDNISSEGANGLPVITTNLTIWGAGTSSTIIQRDPGAPEFRVLEVGSTGVLTLSSLTIQGNGYIENQENQSVPFGGLGLLNIGLARLGDVAVRGFAGRVSGAGIRNTGNLILLRTLVEGNQADDGSGAGILNTGTIQINRSTIRNNHGWWTFGGGISTGPNPAIISASSITGNFVSGGNGGGIDSEGGLTIKNTTIQKNHMDSTDSGGGGLYAGAGTTILESCTIADNGAGYVGIGGGIFTASGATVQMRNTILARNVMGTADDPPFAPQDCFGPITSLGHNIFGDTNRCNIGLASTDYVGDARLGTFTDQIRAADGSLQGNGQIPLLTLSPAIDAGDTSVCSASDQLGYPRVDANLNDTMTCDIGASEYAPSVNAWVTLVSSQTVSNTNPKSGYPAGTTTVTRQYRMATDTVLYPAFVIRAIPAGAVLINSDPPSPGGVGARLTPNVGSDFVWSPGETITVTFVFGLQKDIKVPFTADVVGYPHLP